MKRQTDARISNQSFLTGNNNLLESFKDCDIVVLQQKNAIKKVNCGIFLLNIIVTVVLLIVYGISACCMSEERFLQTRELMHWIHSIALILTVLNMKRAIKEAKIAFPKDNLVKIHAANFIVWCVLDTANAVFTILKDKEPNNTILVSYYTVSLVAYCFSIYMNIFLLCLTSKFASENKNAETRDPILGRNVPNIVFLQN